MARTRVVAKLMHSNHKSNAIRKSEAFNGAMFFQNPPSVSTARFPSDLRIGSMILPMKTIAEPPKLIRKSKNSHAPAAKKKSPSTARAKARTVARRAKKPQARVTPKLADQLTPEQLNTDLLTTNDLTKDKLKRARKAKASAPTVTAAAGLQIMPSSTPEVLSFAMALHPPSPGFTPIPRAAAVTLYRKNTFLSTLGYWFRKRAVSITSLASPRRVLAQNSSNMQRLADENIALRAELTRLSEMVQALSNRSAA